MKYFTPHHTKPTKTKDVREPRGNLSANIPPNMRKQIPTKHTNLDLTNIDHVPSNGTHSGPSAVLFVFEDNEAVIKMIVKGRSPTLRHVSRTHRVALGWLFDRINLDRRIHIRHIEYQTSTRRHVDPKVISHVMEQSSSFVSTSAISAPLAAQKNSCLIICANTMAKRMQEQKEKEGIVGEIETCSDELVFTYSGKFLIRKKSPIASKSPGKFTATGKRESRTRRSSKSDAASSSHVRLQEAFLGRSMDTATVKLVATEEVSGDVDLSGSETWSLTTQNSDGETHCVSNSYGETLCIQQLRLPGRSKS